METLIFDIGKTNKKVFVFDENYETVHSEQVIFEEIEDDDGFACDDIEAIKNWILDRAKALVSDENRSIEKINFSTYGASFIHLDKEGTPQTPLYNYLKPFPEDVLKDFYQTYGDDATIAVQTSSPSLDMLNSGFQLVWLKNYKEVSFSKIALSLHLPQYLSYCFTWIPVAEYTSIGCHTALWDFTKNDYHKWVKNEGFEKLFPEIKASNKTITTFFSGKQVEIGIGLHDSSAALLPYLQATTKPFLLISTGTWSISLNPFNHEPLTNDELDHDCLHFLQIEGSPVKASRLFLGQEYKYQIEGLAEAFGVSESDIEQIPYQPSIKVQKEPQFNYKYLSSKDSAPSATDYTLFENSMQAYHQLMFELTELQYESSKLAIGKTVIQQIFIDGGFAKNRLFTELLKRKFEGVEIIQKEYPNGSALGAAMVMNQKQLAWK